MCVGGGLFNHFDGSVDLLDDLDDHYTARTHKKERNWMIEQFQEICRQRKYPSIPIWLEPRWQTSVLTARV